jgi:hypothetical protein
MTLESSWRTGVEHFMIERLPFCGILQSMVLIGKLFGGSKGKPVEIKASASFAPEKHFRRAVKRIFAKYKGTIGKLGQ